MANIIDFNSNIDWNDFQLGKSGKIIKLYYKKKPVCFTTCSLYIPFGVNNYSNQWSNFDNYSVNCSFLDTVNKDSFLQFFNKLDEKIKNLVFENLDLFKVVDEKQIVYCSLYKKQATNSTYPPMINLNFKRDTNGNFSSCYFDDTNQIQLTESNISEMIPNKSFFKSIISVNKISFYNNNIYIKLDIEQLKKNNKNKANSPSTCVNTDFTQLLIVDDDD
jgi:hypothetical protein